jgi:hypothetical protein
VDLGGFAPPSRTLFSLLHTAITFSIVVRRPHTKLLNLICTQCTHQSSNLKLLMFVSFCIVYIYSLGVSTALEMMSYTCAYVSVILSSCCSDTKSVSSNLTKSLAKFSCSFFIWLSTYLFTQTGTVFSYRAHFKKRCVSAVAMPVS